MPSYSKKKKYSSIAKVASRAATKAARQASRDYTRGAYSTQPMFVARSFGNPRAITERKYFDSEKDYTAIAAGSTSWAGGEYDPTANSLFNPALGDDFNNRTGRKVQVLGINIRGAVHVPPQTNQTATDYASTVRILLVQDKQTNAAQLNAEDVINSASATAGTAVYMFSNPAFFGRFKILKDKQITIQNPNLSWDGTNMEQCGLERPFHIRIKFKKPVVVHYNSTNGGTVADIIDNSFHIIAQTSYAALVPYIVYKCRTTFLDM